MHFQKLLSLVLGLVSIAQGLRQNIQITPQEARVSYETFLITNIFAHSFSDPETSWNQTLSFLFTDGNSNTSAICTRSWTQSSTSAPPDNYSQCDYTGVDEVFQWHFTAFSSWNNFTIEFMHGWNDPEHFPPPWEYVGMFSWGNKFNLTCVEGNGFQGCYLPQSKSPYHAPVNGLTN